MKNAIVVCATPNWLAPAAVTLLSCAQNGAEKIAELIIVSSSVNQIEQQKLATFNRIHNTSIKLINVRIDELEKFATGPLGVGTLMRLKLDEFLPRHFERVLYLDSDVLCETECAPLFAMDMDGQILAAVESTAMISWINPKTNSHKMLIGLALDAPYFNAGVLLFDWQKILKSKFLQTSLALLHTNPSWRFNDQDVLNAVAQGRWKKLSHNWNLTKKTADYLSMKPGFRHFNGPLKPWNCKTRFGYAKYRKYYEQSLATTDWADFIKQPQKPWPIRENWMAIVRSLSVVRIAKLRSHLKKCENSDKQL